MGNYHDTLLECRSNNQLLQKIDPRDIIKKTESQFISCKDGVYYFQTHRGALHQDIVELSKEYPEEVFIARIWNVDWYESELRTVRYKSGKAKFIKIEPNYQYSVSHLEKIMGVDNFNKLMKIAMRYIEVCEKLERIPEVKDQIAQERKDKVFSHVTVNVEDEKFKINATRMTYSSIEVIGYVKEVPTKLVWKLIEEEKRSYKRNDQKNEYGLEEAPEEEYSDLPF